MGATGTWPVEVTFRVYDLHSLWNQRLPCPESLRPGSLLAPPPTRPAPPREFHLFLVQYLTISFFYLLVSLTLDVKFLCTSLEYLSC